MAPHRFKDPKKIPEIQEVLYKNEKGEPLSKKGGEQDTFDLKKKADTIA